MSTMLRFLLPALAVTAGVAAACQAAANSALATRASLGAALFLNTAIVWAGTFILMLASGGPGALRALPGAPPHHYIAGLCGFVVIASITFVLPRLGAAVTLALMVMGQGAMALAVDHFGLWGLPAVPVSLTRLAGVGFLVLGILLLRK
jgi:bacterial/archaeal transporter family-2 protein